MICTDLEESKSRGPDATDDGAGAEHGIASFIPYLEKAVGGVVAGRYVAGDTSLFSRPGEPSCASGPKGIVAQLVGLSKFRIREIVPHGVV